LQLLASPNTGLHLIPATAPNGFVGAEIVNEAAPSLCLTIPATPGPVTWTTCTGSNTQVLSVGGTISNYASVGLHTDATGAIQGTFNPGIAPGWNQWTATGLNMSIRSTDMSGGSEPYYATVLGLGNNAQAYEETGTCSGPTCSPKPGTQIFYPFLDSTGEWAVLESANNNSWATPSQHNAQPFRGLIQFSTGAACQQWGLPQDTTSPTGEITSPCGAGAWTWPNASGALLSLGGSDVTSTITYYPKQ
jgi:hypothetical protein